MNLLYLLYLIYYILCAISILGMVFIEKKKPIRTLAWSFVLFVLPFLGLLIYIFIGYGIGTKTKRLLKRRELINEKYNNYIKKQKKIIKYSKTNDYLQKKYKNLILLNLNNSNSVFTNDNKIEYFFDGNNMLESLKNDLKKATKTINIMFYIFANDSTGKEIRNILIEKAKQGIKVKVLYDAIGSINTNKAFFRKLKKVGGEVKQFFPAFLGLKFLNFKANYRNHRKIVVIDGKTAYTGGMNLRDDHMGKVKRVSPWRDCHIKVIGSSVISLQNIFISDWRLSCKKAEPQDYYLTKDYFYDKDFDGESCMQIVQSGPVKQTKEAIEQSMIKMILTAKKSIKIQTPYFVLDDAFLSALKLAILSGVKVEIIIPKKPDKKLVYYGTLYHINEVIKLGAKVYLYNGFIHTKSLTIDDEVLNMGSCNIDIRSFSLNFEVNSIIYGKNEIKPFIENYYQNLSDSEQIDRTYFEKMNIFKKLALSVARLFSALL